MTSQFDTGFPGLKIRECKYGDTHQETHFVCCLSSSFCYRHLSGDTFYLHYFSQAVLLGSFRMRCEARPWWCMPLIPEFRKKRLVGIRAFKASLVYKGRSSIARATQRNPVLKKPKTKQNKKTTQKKQFEKTCFSSLFLM